MPITNRKDEVMSELLAGISQLTSSDRWQDWLSIQSKFHHYSFGNTLLIQLLWNLKSSSAIGATHATVPGILAACAAKRPRV